VVVEVGGVDEVCCGWDGGGDLFAPAEVVAVTVREPTHMPLHHDEVV